MIILGICNAETSSACLMIDGVMQSAVSEERFSRIKMDNSFPYRSIEYCLSHSGLELSKIDAIGYAWSNGLDQTLTETFSDRKKETLVSSYESQNIFN